MVAPVGNVIVITVPVRYEPGIVVVKPTVQADVEPTVAGLALALLTVSAVVAALAGVTMATHSPAKIAIMASTLSILCFVFI